MAGHLHLGLGASLAHQPVSEKTGGQGQGPEGEGSAKMWTLQGLARMPEGKAMWADLCVAVTMAEALLLSLGSPFVPFGPTSQANSLLC